MTEPARIDALTVAQAAQIMRETLDGRERIYCYAIREGAHGPVKIGLAKNPAQRLRTLQTGNPTRLHGLAAWRVPALEEAQIHAEFADARIRGEWFHPTPELLDLVETLGGDWDDW